ncbi:MAG: GntR family transcriptional regulator [Alphaproteobacteria bacterium]
MPNGVAVKQIRRQRSLAELATKEIRTAIINGDLGLGEPISEGALAMALGISKTPVREALAQLRVEGLVTIVPQKGAFVFTLSAKEVIQICELRYTLESAALRFSYERNYASYCEALQDVVRKMTQVGCEDNVREYLRLDTVFHEQFFKYCDNACLADAYNLIVGKVAALRTHLAARPEHTSKSYKEHMEIANALQTRDPDGAIAILEVHIARTKESYSQNIEDIAAADRASRSRKEPSLALKSIRR